MARIVFTTAVLWSIFVSGQVQASIFPGQIANGLNVFEDQSREQFFDIDMDGEVSDGDVLVTYIRVDDQTTPPFGALNNRLYAVASQQFAGDPIATVISGTETLYSFTFTPTTVAGLTLGDLLSTVVDSAAYAALFEGSTAGDFARNLITQSAEDAPFGTYSPDVFGAIDYLVDNGTLVLTAGERDSDDFFDGRTSVLTMGADDFVDDPSLLATLTLSDTLGTFAAGLSVLDNFFPIIYNDVLTLASHPGEVFEVVLSGTFRGASDAGLDTDSDTVADTFPFQFTDNATLRINATVIPEPAALVTWGLLSLIGAIGAMRSRTTRLS